MDIPHHRSSDSLQEHEMKKKRKVKHSKETRKKHSKRDRHSSASKKKARRRYSSDSTDTSDSEESSSSLSESWSSSLSPKPKKRKKLRDSKGKQKHKSKHKKDKLKKKADKDPDCLSSSHIIGPSVPPTLSSTEVQRKMQASENVGDIKTIIAAQSAKVKGPMTKEEYERQQSVVRRVYDPDTGRHRLVKGDGEIIEEIVSKERHKAINKQATLGDGSSFQALTRNLT